MTRNNPKISVIMSAFNTEKFITSAMQSILNQSYDNFEFIIVDDASQDSTLEKIKTFQKEDKRIKIIQNNENIGLTKSLNNALKIAKGKYIARQDADDYSTPARLEKQLNFLESNKEITLVGTSATIIDDDGNELCKRHLLTDPKEIKTKMQKQNCVFHGSIMFRKKNIQIIGNYRELFKYGQDYDLYLRLCEQKKIANMNELLYFWRFSRSSVSAKQTLVQSRFGELARLFANERAQTGRDSYGKEFIDRQLSKISYKVQTKKTYEYQKAIMLIRAKNNILDKKIFFSNPTLFIKYLYYLIK